MIVLDLSDGPRRAVEKAKGLHELLSVHLPNHLPVRDHTDFARWNFVPREKAEYRSARAIADVNVESNRFQLHDPRYRAQVEALARDYEQRYCIRDVGTDIEVKLVVMPQG